MMRFNSILLQTTTVLFFTASIWADEQEPKFHHQYFADAKVFSMTDEAIDSFRGYGGGGVGPGGSLGLYVQENDRNIEIEIKGSLREKKFVANLSVKPKGADKLTKPVEQEFVLSGLEPKTMELGRDEDGRVYQLQILPHVKVSPLLNTFDADKMRLDAFSFNNSFVIVNDQDSVGRLNMSSGQLAGLDLSLALVEFSLIPFRDAEPIGTFKDGTIHITHDSGTSIEIRNVRNGNLGRALPGGPYKVFVRWSPPTMTPEEIQEQTSAMISHFKAAIEQDDVPIEQKKQLQAVVERMESNVGSDRVTMISSRLGPLIDKDRLPE